MTDQVALASECRKFTRYLIDSDPDAYVCDRYSIAVQKLQHACTPRHAFDRLLLALARLHPLLTQAVDVYARFFLHASAVRSRLVLLLAILESHAATAAPLEQPDYAGPAGFFAGMAWRSLLLAIILLFAILLLLPVQLLSGGLARRGAGV